MAVKLTEAAIRKGVKKCRVCKQTKPITEFIKNLTTDTKWMPNDCLDCERGRQKVRHKSNTHERTYTEYKKLKADKPNKCEVCASTEIISYDHCHLTNLHRGWLCHKCNSILGFAKDNPDRLRKLADYIERFHNSSELKQYLNKIMVLVQGKTKDD